MTTCICLIYIVEIKLAHHNILQMPGVFQSVHIGMLCLLDLFDRQVSSICYIVASLTDIVPSSVSEVEMICWGFIYVHYWRMLYVHQDRYRESWHINLQDVYLVLDLPQLMCAYIFLYMHVWKDWMFLLRSYFHVCYNLLKFYKQFFSDFLTLLPGFILSSFETLPNSISPSLSSLAPKTPGCYEYWPNLGQWYILQNAFEKITSRSWDADEYQMCIINWIIFIY